MKCVLCKRELAKQEFLNLADEFKRYPVHDECFDTFDDADAFLDWAKSKRRLETAKLWDHLLSAMAISLRRNEELVYFDLTEDLQRLIDIMEKEFDKDDI